MKKFSVVMALMIALFIGGKASAESWVVIDKTDFITTSIDKDSIKRGTESKNFPKFNRKDGYSAKIKFDFEFKEKEIDDFSTVNLVSFYEKDGERMFCTLDGYDGTDYPEKESQVEQEKVDIKGRVMPKVWDYIEKNLK